VPVVQVHRKGNVWLLAGKGFMQCWLLSPPHHWMQVILEYACAAVAISTWEPGETSWSMPFSSLSWQICEWRKNPGLKQVFRIWLCSTPVWGRD
jgi:hypothetical protein